VAQARQRLLLTRSARAEKFWQTHLQALQSRMGMAAMEAALQTGQSRSMEETLQAALALGA
jgi:hypothetical protein